MVYEGLVAWGRQLQWPVGMLSCVGRRHLQGCRGAQWCGSVDLYREASEVGDVGVLSGVGRQLKWYGEASSVVRECSFV